ncbi:MAG TPA: SCO6880 family protein, partial [Candidatus Dormibacteraeota bacterium]
RGEEQAACTVLAQQLAGLSDRLRRADIVVEGVLTPRRVARIIRLAYDPAAMSPIARAGIQDADPGVDPSDAWPMGTHDLWSMLRTDSAVHRTYWVRQWPRTEVGPDWLSPPLLGCGRHMRVSMVIEPVDLARAGRAVPYRHTAHITVTAATPDALEVACIDVEQSAIAARLQLRRMVGEQADAFTLTLPLCRGLA